MGDILQEAKDVLWGIETYGCNIPNIENVINQLLSENKQLKDKSEILREIRPGDAYMLDCLIGFVERRDTCGEYGQHLAVLKKYCHMAAKMETKDLSKGHGDSPAVALLAAYLVAIK
jgi:hypothetical protein